MSKFVRNEKPRMGILPIAKTNQYQGNIRKYIEAAKAGFGNDENMEIIMGDEPLWEMDEIMKTVDKMEKHNVDMYLFVIEIGRAHV